MVKTPQRGRRTSAPVSMININIDPELKHELKKISLDARVTTTRYVRLLIEEALEGADGARAPGAAYPPACRKPGGGTKLGFNIDAELHRRLKRAALDANLTVTEYLTRLVEQAVSAAQGARGGRG